MSESTLPPGAFDVPGRGAHMTGPAGELIPLAMVKPQDLLQDGAVRELMGEADQLSAAISAFRTAAFEKVAALVELLRDQYGSKAGSGKGNLTLATIDGLWRVQVQVADRIRFGAELQVAKGLVDELVSEWSADANAELKAIVLNAFNVDKEGQINRGALLGLLRLNITEPRWLRAMDALRDSIKVDGSAEYIRFQRRPNPKARWETVSLNIATAGE